MPGMFSAMWNGVIYNPLYNGLVYLIDVIPTHDVGIAVIALTIVVRLVLFPLSKRAVTTQEKMRAIAPEIEELKKKHKNDREVLGRSIFDLYRQNDIHPFASFFLIFLQLPILFALYFVFALGKLPVVDIERLYSFVPVPTSVNMDFLGILDMADRSIILAMLAVVTQLVYTRLSMGPRKKHGPSDGSFSGDMAKSFDIQMRYVLPLIIGVVAYTIPAAAPLYWVTSNLFMIGQELVIGKRFKYKETALEAGVRNFPSL